MFSSMRLEILFLSCCDHGSLFFHKSILMNNYKENFGIDISHLFFDVTDSDGNCYLYLKMYSKNYFILRITWS